MLTGRLSLPSSPFHRLLEISILSCVIISKPNQPLFTSRSMMVLCLHNLSGYLLISFFQTLPMCCPSYLHSPRPPSTVSVPWPTLSSLSQRCPSQRLRLPLPLHRHFPVNQCQLCLSVTSARTPVKAPTMAASSDAFLPL